MSVINYKAFAQLLGILILTLLSLTGCGSSSSASNSNTAQPPTNTPVSPPATTRVIIVGAGSAGLSAGFELHNAGLDVVVLEARDRIGGRVWSDRRDNQQSVDLGAAWIHGISGNPVHDLAQQQGLELTPTDYDNGVLKNDPDGSQITTAEILSIMNLLFNKLDSSSSASTTTSISAIVEQVMAENPNISPQKMQFVISSFVEQPFAGPVEELSLHALEEGEEEFGGGDVMFPTGYDRIFNDMVAALDIRLEQIVTDINYTDTEIQISTADNTVYVADKVIVTVPLGVLQRDAINFEPALPQSKQVAINALGMGVFNKVYLGFEEVFWETEADVIEYYSDTKILWSSIFNMFKQYGDPALLAISTADEGIAMEAKTDDQIVDELMSILKEQYGDDIPQPNDVRITRWQQDPFSYGSYSFMKTGASNQSRIDLAETVDDKVYFAGEATSSEFPATVHGALLSGIREAEKIK